METSTISESYAAETLALEESLKAQKLAESQSQERNAAVIKAEANQVTGAARPKQVAGNEEIASETPNEPASAAKLPTPETPTANQDLPKPANPLEERESIDRSRQQKEALADKQVKYQMVAGTLPAAPPPPAENGQPVPAPQLTETQQQTVADYGKGQKSADEVVKSFGGLRKMQSYFTDLQKSGAKADDSRFNLLKPYYEQILRQQDAIDSFQRRAEFIDLPSASAKDLSNKVFEFGDKWGLAADQRQEIVDKFAAQIAPKDLARANELQALSALRGMSPADQNQFLKPTDLVLRSLDKASELAGKGYSEGAAQFLEQQAKVARERLQITPSDSPNTTLLRGFADNADAQAKALRAVTPKQGYEAARELNQQSRQAEKAAEALEKDENFEQAKLLRTISQGSAWQAHQTNIAATNTNVMFGKAIGESYRQLVNASFDGKIKDTSDNTFFGLRDSPAQKLRDQKQKMNVVFDELNRAMSEKGVSFDRAWDDMVNDSGIDGWNNAPKRVPGFPTRQDAAHFLRDNPVTKGLVSPFADLARGISDGDNATIDKASGDIIKTLKDNGQWNIAEALTKDFQKNARTPDGKANADDLASRQTWDWLKAKSGEFILDEMPTMVLAGVISGGAGWGVKALTTAAKWGPRAIGAATAVTEFGTFLGSQRLLDDAINGKKADWSAQALARDAALQATFMLGGKALGKAVGKGWEALRVNNFGVPAAFQQMRGRLAGMNQGEREMLESLNKANGGRLLHNGEIGLDTLARLTNVTKTEIALLRNQQTGQSMLLKGAKGEIPQLTGKEAERLAKEGWELQAHSHLRDLRPSIGDGAVVKAFGQETSVIVNQRGKWLEFMPEQAFGGKVGNLSNGLAPTAANAANAAALTAGKWLGKKVKDGDKLPAGYHWKDGDIYRNPGKVEGNFAPLQFDKTTGKVVLREGIERLSIPSVMRRNFEEQTRQSLTAQGLTGKRLENAIEKEMARTQIHHLLPDEIVQKTELGKLAQKAGYNLDRSDNLLGLARSAADKKAKTDVGHWTSHPKYSREVEAEMDKTLNALKQKYGKKAIPQQEVLDEMRRIEEMFRKKINDGKVPQIDGRLAELTSKSMVATA